MNNYNPLQDAKDLIHNCLEHYFKESNLAFDSKLIKIETPPDSAMGNMALACFPFAKMLRKSPNQISQDFHAAFTNENKTFSKVEIKGPYLNFFFSENFLNQVLQFAAQNETYGSLEYGKKKKVMIEFSSPNTNKPLHLGHGRNNILGMTLSNLFSFVGYDVVKTNLVNDRGVHICKSMLAYKLYGNEITPEKEGLKGDKLVGNYYVLFDKKSKEDESLIEQAQEMLVAWENEDPETRVLWQNMNNWVLDGFKETYARMGISFDQYYYESNTYKGGKEIVLQGLKDGVLQQEDNGAISIDLEEQKLGKKILLRGDGTSVYITQDINTTIQKFNDFKLDQCLFVVGNEQENHFKVLFNTLLKLGNKWASTCEHISYGMILLPEGKMKSREGTVVDLDELMDQLRDIALVGFEERESNGPIKEQKEKEYVSEAVAQAALKYYILKTNASKNMLFNPKESLSFEGDTGPYLQYTHARICTLLEKSERDLLDLEIKKPWNELEKEILGHLVNFPQNTLQSVLERNPSYLTAYIYQLCRLFNKYYYEYKILKSEDEETILQRLLLAKSIRNVLSSALKLFGIIPLEKM